MSARPFEVLVRPLAAGPDRPFSVQQVIARHHEALLRFLRKRLAVPEDAQDIAQETYLKLLQYETSTQIRSPSSMLYRVAINVARDRGRAERTRRAGTHSSLEDHDLVGDEPSPERDLAGRQELDIVLEAIEALPPKCRQVFLLSRVHHLTYPQIAARCGISVKMVEKHISHALEVCLRRMADRS